MASNISDITTLNARSLALSVLLGTHPPALSASALVALAELFDISGGTMRTALSRLVANGDLVADDATYRLAPRLIERQRRQDAGRRAELDWDGTWHIAVAVAEHRELADRRRVRGSMVSARFAELRPTVWLRPSNLPTPTLADDRADWLLTTGPVDVESPRGLVARLWDVAAIGERARRLSSDLDRASGRLDTTDSHHIPAAFVLSANIVRFLRDEPMLPRELAPPDWPVEQLRETYDDFELRLQDMMRPFLLHHDR